jgi:hypothetical protein
VFGERFAHALRFTPETASKVCSLEVSSARSIG